MCGIVGIWNAPKAAEKTFLALHALQHRAQDYAGIATHDGSHFHWARDHGLVSEVFAKRDTLNMLHGWNAVGHLRYPTVEEKTYARDAGDPDPNMQPIRGLWQHTEFFLAHNGNITNVPHLRMLVKDKATRLKTDMDSEIIVRLIEQQRPSSFLLCLEQVLKRVRGSYSLVILLPTALIAVRGPEGNRPLVYGYNEEHGFSIIASESCALDAVDARYIGEVRSGTAEVFTINGRQTPHRFTEPRLKRCSFELPYYSHVTSDVFGKSVADWRMRAGKRLEELHPVPHADLVIGVPDSGITLAQGWATSGRSGRVSVSAVAKSGYAQRTFIARSQTLRAERVRMKFLFSRSELEGKTVVLLDDSIVRLTTMPEVVSRVRKAGAKEVHVRVAFPPIRHPCLYGIDTPTRAELSAANLSKKEMLKKVGADTLEFLDLDSLLSLSGDEPGTWCTACVTGKYWH
ncbi:MAG: amidophosphoribosyltransferase [Candidatus Pacebacteria bacterium]|nr:amidophosphoribosyltransferase [Candidatus Paceibacterota bacterium]MBP9840668.1 amidophosphoribosyltransferase [Candidatus Paceibacterota bacterium]